VVSNPHLEWFGRRLLERDHYYRSSGFDTLLDKGPLSYNQLAPELRNSPLTTFMILDQRRRSEGMIYKPMNPYHDRQTGILVCLR